MTVQVRFHVIAKDRGQEGGNLSAARIAEQIRVLDEAYAPHGFDFELERITRTFEPQWFNLISSNGAEPRYFRGGGKEVAMKKALYGDSTSETLNIYSASLGQSLLGLGLLPVRLRRRARQGQPAPAVPRRCGRRLPQPAHRARRHRRRLRLRHLRRGRHRHARGRALARAVPHVPGWVRGRRRLRRRHRTGGVARRSGARRAATPARAAGSTRSPTSWTTPRTPA